MQQPILVQDWVTLRGMGAATAVTFVPHRSRWMWSGDAQAVAMVIEIKELHSANEPGGPITLRLATAACENGPWFKVKDWTGPGDDRLFLRRDATLTDEQRFLGYLRWELIECATAATGEWEATFRIVAVEESTP